MDNDEYNKVEFPALEQLQALGWGYLHGSSVSPESSNERKYYREVVLEQRLTQAVKKINPWINDENLRKVIREITHPKVATLQEANCVIWETLVQYQSVDQDIGKGRKGQIVKIIDFENPENNDFLCVNQFKVEGVKSAFEKTQGETVYHAKSVAELKALLQKDASDLVIGMIQKFQENDDNFEFLVLNESEKIVVLADEAHRSQLGGLGVALIPDYLMLLR